MRNFYLRMLGILVIAFGANYVNAQNETCATALEIVPGTFTIDTLDNGNGASNICASLATTHSQWFVFESPFDGTVTINTIHPDDPDSQVGILSGTCGALNCLTYSNLVGLDTITMFSVIANTNYYLEFDDSWSASGFDFEFIFEPVNDECANAAPITIYPENGSTGNETFLNAAFATANTSNQIPCLFGNASDFNDVFYEFTTNATQTVINIIIDDTAGLVQLAVLDACGGNSIFCTDAAGTVNSVSGLTPNTTYILQIGHLTDEIEPFSLALEEGVECEAGEPSAASAALDVALCPTSTVSFETDGSEIVPPGETYGWVFIDTASTNGDFVGAVLGTSYSGVLYEDIIVTAGGNMPAGVYGVLGVVTSNGGMDICDITNFAFYVTFLEPMGLECNPNCVFGEITAGTQTACDPATNTYTQVLTITYNNQPIIGNLNVNGQLFPIGTSPQVVTLTDLPADGQAVDVTAFFTEATTCTIVSPSSFTAPTSCNPSSLLALNLADFKIYPNPSNGSFNLKLEAAQHTDFIAKVYDVTGKVVFETKWLNINGYVSKSIDLGAVMPGVYILELSNENGSIQEKLTIHR